MHLLLGTAFTANRLHAKALGYALHFVAGVAFALGYDAIFAAVDGNGSWLGAGLGVLHAAFAATALVNLLLPLVHPRIGASDTGATSVPLLEPPGFLMLKYGPQTPVATLVAHVAYGALVGGFMQLAG